MNSHVYIPLNAEHWNALLPDPLHPPTLGGSIYCSRCNVRANTDSCIRSAGRAGNAVLLCRQCGHVIWSMPRPNNRPHPWKGQKEKNDV